MHITKFDNLTTDELLTLAYEELTDADELALALMSRLADVNDELDQWKADYESEVADAMDQIRKNFAEVADAMDQIRKNFERGLH